jgi:hypothetical protein
VKYFCCNDTVLDINGSEIRQMYRNYHSVIRLLVDIVFIAKYAMDCLINLMNSKHFFPLIIVDIVVATRGIYLHV